MLLEAAFLKQGKEWLINYAIKFSRKNKQLVWHYWRKDLIFVVTPMFKLAESMRKIYGRRYNKLSLRFKNWMEQLVKIRLPLHSSKSLRSTWVFLLLTTSYLKQFFIIFGSLIIQQISLKNMLVLVKFLIQLKKDIYMIIIGTYFMEDQFLRVLLLEPQSSQLHTSRSTKNFDINLLRL